LTVYKPGVHKWDDYAYQHKCSTMLMRKRKITQPFITQPQVTRVLDKKNAIPLSSQPSPANSRCRVTPASAVSSYTSTYSRGCFIFPCNSTHSRRCFISPCTSAHSRGCPYCRVRPRTPEAASYRPPNAASSCTPGVWTYRPTTPAPVTPGTAPYGSYRNATPLRNPDQVTSHRAATNQCVSPFTAPSPSNDHVLARRPSVSLFTQPVVHSSSYNRSRAVSSTARVQHQTTSAASSVSGSSMAPLSGRSRTVSSGSSMRPSWPTGSTYMNPSFPASTGLHKDTTRTTSNQRHTTKNQTNQTLQQNETHRQARPVGQESTAVLRHPMLNDVGLITAITAARGDRREFPWYPVWVIAIKDWMFANSHTPTVACNIAPQYVLEQWYTTKTSVKPKKTWAVPDFAQVLQHLQTSKNGTRKIARQKVILVVENKPELPRKRFLEEDSDPWEEVLSQVNRQVAFAFLADPSLHVIGAILAFGARWKYLEFDRARTNHLKAYIKKRADMKRGEQRLPLVNAVPAELAELSPLGDNTIELLDHMGRSAQAFEIIAQRIKSRESQMWNLVLMRSKNISPRTNIENRQTSSAIRHVVCLRTPVSSFCSVKACRSFRLGVNICTMDSTQSIIIRRTGGVCHPLMHRCITAKFDLRLTGAPPTTSCIATSLRREPRRSVSRQLIARYVVRRKYPKERRVDDVDEGCTKLYQTHFDVLS
jgi:hypothetical protein